MKRMTILLLVLLIMPGLALAAKDFQVDITYAGNGLISGSALAGLDSLIRVEVSNIGNERGEMKVETGIYLEDTVEDWYGQNFFAISSSQYMVPNCPGSGSNVETIAITLDPGEKKVFEFTPKTPLDYTKEYVVHTAAYEKCYADSPGDTGQTSFDVRQINVLKNSNVVIAETCSDGIKNQDESDTDCGGVCGACRDYYECRFDQDCKTGSACVGNGLGETICAPRDDPVQEINGGELEEPLPSPSETTDPDTSSDDLSDKNIAPDDTPDQEVTDEVEVVSPKSESKWVTVPVIKNAERAFGNGEPITIKAVFRADVAGTYLLEAGIGKVGEALSIGLQDNSCDPGEIEFANGEVELTAGTHEIEFEVGSREDGQYRFWVASVDECGGTVQHQVKGKGLLQVGIPGDGVGEPFEFGGGVIAALIVLVIGGLALTGWWAFR